MAPPEPATAIAGPSAVRPDAWAAAADEAASLLRGPDGEATYTPEEEAAVVRKFDRKLVVFVALLYMFSFLDRSSMLSLLRKPTLKAEKETRR